MDYSFLKLYNSIDDALNDNEFKDATTHYYTNTQLLTDEPYCQMTNVNGGISLTSDITVHLVDACENELKDITAHVFTEEFIDNDGNNQVKIEFVNIDADYFGRAVFIRISQNSSDTKYYTRPIKVTNKDVLKTYRFDYKNITNLEGLSYVDAGVYQSIRLNMKFTGYVNNSEVGEYYQISTKNNISTRFLRKIGSSYLIENIDTFTFNRLQELLSHNEIYLDGKRITNKPVLEQSDRIGQSNLFKANFTAFVSEEDTYDYDYQVFEGLELSNFTPIGVHVTGTVFTTVSFDANLGITLNEGTLRIYNSLGTLQDSFTEADMTVSGNTVSVTTSLSYPNDTYIIEVSEGLVSAIGVENNLTIWNFELRDADYSTTDYDDTDYFSN